MFTDHIRANQLASLVRFGVSLLISILLVRFHFTRSIVGHFEYVLLFALTFSFFISYAYANALLSRLGKIAKVEHREELTQVFWQLNMWGIIFGLAGMILIKTGDFIDTSYVSGKMPILIGLYIFFLAANSLPETIFVLNKEAKSIVLYHVIVYGIQLFLVIICMFYGWSIFNLFYAYLAWQGMRYFYSIILIKPVRWVLWAKQRIWLVFALPLIFHFILGSGMDYLDGHLVSWFFNEEDFLFYRYGAKELPFSLLLVNALTASMLPILASNMDALNTLKNKLSNISHIIFPLSILFMFLSPLLFTLVYGEEFITSALIFNIYLLIISSRILVPHVILYAKEENKALMYFSAMELLINFALSLIFLQFWSYFGIALATVIAFLSNRIMISLYCKRKFNISVREYLPIRMYSAYMLLLMVSFTISYQLFF